MTKLLDMVVLRKQTRWLTREQATQKSSSSFNYKRKDVDPYKNRENATIFGTPEALTSARDWQNETGQQCWPQEGFSK